MMKLIQKSNNFSLKVTSRSMNMEKMGKVKERVKRIIAARATLRLCNAD